jgi:predicted TIM-barrel enzyme
MAGIMNEWRKDLDSHRLNDLGELFSKPKPVIAMVHVPPLPGSVRYTGYSMQQIIDFAINDAQTLVKGGVDGLIVENMWDLPYAVGTDVSPEQQCAQTAAAAEVVKTVDIPINIDIVKRFMEAVETTR